MCPFVALSLGQVSLFHMCFYGTLPHCPIHVCSLFHAPTGCSTGLPFLCLVYPLVTLSDLNVFVSLRPLYVHSSPLLLPLLLYQTNPCPRYYSYKSSSVLTSPCCAPVVIINACTIPLPLSRPRIYSYTIGTRLYLKCLELINIYILH